jgi:hypothetical protein
VATAMDTVAMDIMRRSKQFRGIPSSFLAQSALELIS